MAGANNGTRRLRPNLLIKEKNLHDGWDDQFECHVINEDLKILKVDVFDESSKQIAKDVASKFPGVTEVVEVKGGGQLEVRGDFSISKLKKELKKTDFSQKEKKLKKELTEPEVKIQQQDEGKRPINIQKASKALNYNASSSNRPALQNNRFTWEQVKGVGAGAAEQVQVIGAGAVEQVKVIGAGAAKQAKDIGAGAFNLLPNSIKWHFREKPRKEHMAVVLYGKEEKMRQEKEEEKRRKHASENNSGGTSMVGGITESLRNAVSKLTTSSEQALETGQPSTSTAQTQRTGQSVRQSNTNFQHKQETRPVEKKGKNGR